MEEIDSPSDGDLSLLDSQEGRDGRSDSIGMESESDDDSAAHHSDADDEEWSTGSDSGDGQPHPAKKTKNLTQERTIKSHTHKDAKNPEKSAVRRAQRIAREVLVLLNKRGGIKIDVLNRIILGLNQAERAELRMHAAVQQEHYLAKRDAVEFMNKNCFTALKVQSSQSSPLLSFPFPSPHLLTFSHIPSTTRSPLTCVRTRPLLCDAWSG